MLDLLRSALRSTMSRSSIAPTSSPWCRRPIPAANVPPVEAELARREDFGQLFDAAYLNRDLVCLGCHNSDFSVTSRPEPADNRHWPPVPAPRDRDLRRGDRHRGGARARRLPLLGPGHRSAGRGRDPAVGLGCVVRQLRPRRHRSGSGRRGRKAGQPHRRPPHRLRSGRGSAPRLRAPRRRRPGPRRGRRHLRSGRGHGVPGRRDHRRGRMARGHRHASHHRQRLPAQRGRARRPGRAHRRLPGRRVLAARAARQHPDLRLLQPAAARGRLRRPVRHAACLRPVGRIGIRIRRGGRTDRATPSRRCRRASCCAPRTRRSSGRARSSTPSPRSRPSSRSAARPTPARRWPASASARASAARRTSSSAPTRRSNATPAAELRAFERGIGIFLKHADRGFRGLDFQARLVLEDAFGACANPGPAPDFVADLIERARIRRGRHRR